MECVSGQTGCGQCCENCRRPRDRDDGDSFGKCFIHQSVSGIRNQRSACVGDHGDGLAALQPLYQIWSSSDSLCSW